jgi:hypothetical protein
MIKRHVPALFLTFAILLAIPTMAQQGGQAIGACTVIDKPGSYVLARDISASMADLKRVSPGAWYSGCIVIVADFVSLDLQGHTITGPGIQGTWNISGIYTTADAGGKQSQAARIRNGCVTNFDFGVGLEGTGHVVEQMRVARNLAGISLSTDGNTSNGLKVRDVTAVENDRGIISYGGSGNSVEGCQLISNHIGFYQHEHLPDNPRPLGTRIVGNTVSGNGSYGIYVYCPSLILQNMAYNNGSGEQDNIVVNGTTCTRANNSPEP